MSDSRGLMPGGTKRSTAPEGVLTGAAPPAMMADVDLSERRRPGAEQRRLAYCGAALGIGYAAVSAYWAIGGTALLDTIGGSLERTGRAGGLAVSATLWAVVLLKLLGAGLPLAVVSDPAGIHQRRVLYRIAQLEAVILIGYGLVLTTVGLLVQAGVIHRSAHTDRRALAWHAFLWDPWFLIWGLAVAATLRSFRTATVNRCLAQHRSEQLPPARSAP